MKSVYPPTPHHSGQLPRNHYIVVFIAVTLGVDHHQLNSRLRHHLHRSENVHDVDTLAWVRKSTVIALCSMSADGSSKQNAKNVPKDFHDFIRWNFIILLSLKSNMIVKIIIIIIVILHYSGLIYLQLFATRPCAYSPPDNVPCGRYIIVGGGGGGGCCPEELSGHVLWFRNDSHSIIQKLLTFEIVQKKKNQGRMYRSKERV